MRSGETRLGKVRQDSVKVLGKVRFDTEGFDETWLGGKFKCYSVEHEKK